MLLDAENTGLIEFCRYNPVRAVTDQRRDWTINLKTAHVFVYSDVKEDTSLFVLCNKYRKVYNIAVCFMYS